MLQQCGKSNVINIIQEKSVNMIWSDLICYKILKSIWSQLSASPETITSSLGCCSVGESTLSSTIGLFGCKVSFKLWSSRSFSASFSCKTITWIHETKIINPEMCYLFCFRENWLNVLSASIERKYFFSCFF